MICICLQWTLSLIYIVLLPWSQELLNQMCVWDADLITFNWTILICDINKIIPIFSNVYACLAHNFRGARKSVVTSEVWILTCVTSVLNLLGHPVNTLSAACLYSSTSVSAQNDPGVTQKSTGSLQSPVPLRGSSRHLREIEVWSLHRTLNFNSH